MAGVSPGNAILLLFQIQVDHNPPNSSGGGEDVLAPNARGTSGGGGLSGRWVAGGVTDAAAAVIGAKASVADVEHAGGRGLCRHTVTGAS